MNNNNFRNFRNGSLTGDSRNLDGILLNYSFLTDFEKLIKYNQ